MAGGQPAGVDADEQTPLARLKQELSELRMRKGHTYRSLAEAAHYSAGMLNRVVKNDDKLPSWGITKAFAQACDGDVEHVRTLWNAAAQSSGGDEVIESAPELVGVRRLQAWTRRSRARAAAAAALGLLLVVGLVAGSVWIGVQIARPAPQVAPGFTGPIVPPDQCYPGMLRRGPDRECVGITDGAFTFAPELGLAGILQAIKRENDIVYDSGAPSVSLAYVAPLPKVPLAASETTYLESVKHELQGALLAQLRANEGVSLGDVPKIRLLVVNVGDGSKLWSDVVPDLLAQRDSPNRVVAVIGMGNSVRPTLEMIDALAGKIPMFPSRLTADSLSAAGNNQVQGLFRVAPSNAAETAVAAGYAKSNATKVLVVEDRNPSDNYTADLRDGFNQAFSSTGGGGELAAPEVYNSALDGTANAFVQMNASICSKQPDLIYFAGRGSDLGDFLQALATRDTTCRAKKLTVLTGDDGVSVTLGLRSDLAQRRLDLANALAQGNIGLRYTALSHPGAWSTPGAAFLPAAIAPFTGTCSTCLAALFPNSPTDDDAAIMTYDSALVPITCLRSAARDQQQIPDPYFYTAGLTTQLCYRVSQATPVQGASGPIAFDANGNAVGKSVPIVELRPDGSTTLTQLAVAS